MVSIVAFQAVDPSSVLGHRRLFIPLVLCFNVSVFICCSNYEIKVVQFIVYIVVKSVYIVYND